MFLYLSVSVSVSLSLSLFNLSLSLRILHEVRPVLCLFQYDHAAIRQALFDAGRSAKVSEKTRRRVYGLVKK